MAFSHGLSDTRLHRIWRGMKDRCGNPNNDRYHCYGGRGIEVCEEWKSDFIAFYSWANEHGYEENLSIERKNINKQYTPENCTWVTIQAQQRNKQNTPYALINGATKPLIEWAEQYNIPYKTISSRYRRGWRNERLIKPTRKRAC